MCNNCNICNNSEDCNFPCNAIYERFVNYFCTFKKNSHCHSVVKRLFMRQKRKQKPAEGLQFSAQS